MNDINDKMQRVVIIVKGDVQRVGYRGVVERTARKLQLVGFVENLKPYDIKIVAEGKKKNLEQFIQQIHIKKYPIEVEKIETEFDLPTNEFKYFEIRRGTHEEEVGERLDTVGRLLYRSVELSERSVDLGERSVEEIKTVGNKVDALRGETSQNFNMMDIKYDKVSDKMDSIDHTLKELTKAILKLAESNNK